MAAYKAAAGAAVAEYFASGQVRLVKTADVSAVSWQDGVGQGY